MPAEPSLHDEKCVPCRGDAARASADEIGALLALLPRWQVSVRGGVQVLERRIGCRDFAASLGMANAVGEISHAAGHHPELVVVWGSLTVRWWTHALGGLHRNDFVMAARTDRVLNDSAEPKP